MTVRVASDSPVPVTVTQHSQMVVVMNTYGELVNVTGNENCWYRVKGSLLGLLYFIMNNYKQEPGQKMLRHWVVRDRCFGVKNISNSRIDTATVYC